MSSLTSLIVSLRAALTRDEEGATMVEYGLMVALIAIIAMVAVGLLGDGLTNIFTDANEALPNPGTP